MFVGMVHAQDIQIKVLNGRNGHPVTNECVNVWAGSRRGNSVILPTDQHGIVEIHLGKQRADANTRQGCNGLASVNSVLNYADTLEISADYYVDCRPFKKRPPWPAYSVRAIVQSGIATENTCGKFRAEVKPGELIFFVRPVHWWEAFRR